MPVTLSNRNRHYPVPGILEILNKNRIQHKLKDFESMVPFLPNEDKIFFQNLIDSYKELEDGNAKLNKKTSKKSNKTQNSEQKKQNKRSLQN